MLHPATSIGSAMPGQTQALSPTVEVEENVYSWVHSDNGSFPQWTYGSTILARVGEDLFFSATETIPDQIPLENCRWVLMQRTDDGWAEVQRDDENRTREPSPICAFADGRIFMSVNPVEGPPEESSTPAHPRILQFAAADPSAPPETIEPVFVEDAVFTNHSYRGFGCDPEREELLLVNVEDYRGQHYSFRNAAGEWANWGVAEFPSCDSFKGPLPLRYLYPHVAMRDGAAHVIAKAGLEETDEARHRYRADHNIKVSLRPAVGYCWSPDIANEPLSEWIPIVDVIDQAGEVWNCDLFVDARGDCHILWWESSIDARLRPDFFADVPLTRSIKHAVVRDGAMVSVDTIAEGGEGAGPVRPVWAQFHTTPDGRLFVYYSQTCAGEGCEHPGWSNWIVELTDEGCGEPAKVEVEHPMGNLFMTAKPNGGMAPSNVLEVVGRPVNIGMTINYLRVNLFE